ncbi:MAG: hypothetical protein AAF970_13865 [Bacteroidota bacterium]
MIDTDTSTPETEPPVQRQFLLGRIAAAIKRQDWFWVLVEVIVVVLGVVIGFQVTAWGQAQANRAQEEVYLRQLTGDFRETLTEARQAFRRQQDVSQNVASVLRAYRTPERPPLDSLSVWIGASYNFQLATPILGTAQGIIATGDLSLLRNDSLRAALPAYVERSRERRGSIQVSIDLYGAAFARVLGEADALEMAVLRFRPSLVDSLAEQDPTFPFPAGPRRTPFPTTAEDVLSNPDIYSALVTASFMSGALIEYQSEVAADAAEMLRLVERAQGGSE